LARDVIVIWVKGLETSNQPINPLSQHKERIMKTTLILALVGMLFIGLTASQTATAQSKGGSTTQNGNHGKVRPNFVDANGDGICDNAGTPGHGTGTGVCDGTGAGRHGGNGTGTCTGTGTRQRLRDGSCGITPSPANTPQGVKRQSRAK
jgi:hypothetical protein